MPAIYPYGGPSPSIVDPMSGSGRSTTSTGGGATGTWTPGTRFRISIPASTVGYVDEESTSFVPPSDSWDAMARIQVVTGDGSAQTRFGLIVGKDSNNYEVISMWGDGNIEVARVYEGAFSSAGWSYGPDASIRTGGQLWIRMTSQFGYVRGFWGVGSAGLPPTKWTALGTLNKTSITPLLGAG